MCFQLLDLPLQRHHLPVPGAEGGPEPLEFLAQALQLSTGRVQFTPDGKLKERAVKVDGAVVEDPGATFGPGFEGVLQVGKRNFARVRLLTGS